MQTHKAVSEWHETRGRLLKLLTYWFAPILGTDQFMAKQVVDIQAGVKPEDTYQAEKDIKEESSTEPLLLALNCLFQ